MKERCIECRSIIEFIYSFDCLLSIVFVYLVKKQSNIFPSDLKLFIKNINLVNSVNFYYKYKVFILAAMYLILLLILSFILLKLTSILSEDSIKRGVVQELEIATDSFLPSYLGYFFVALSIDKWQVLFVIFIFIWLFTRKSKQVHFNPIFLILGYKYYFITIDNIKNLLITKQNLRNPKNIEIYNLKRINNYTYIKIEKKGE